MLRPFRDSIIDGLRAECRVYCNTCARAYPLWNTQGQQQQRNAGKGGPVAPPFLHPSLCFGLRARAPQRLEYLLLRFAITLIVIV